MRYWWFIVGSVSLTLLVGISAWGGQEDGPQRESAEGSVSIGRRWLRRDLRITAGQLLIQKVADGEHRLVCRGDFEMTVAGQRYVAQSQIQYRNGAWDLVDAVDEGQVQIEDLKADDLPQAMQKMTLEERKAFVEKNAKQRAQLQAQIKELNVARTRYVAEEMKKLAGGEESLDSAMIKTLRAQAAKKHFEFADASGAATK